MPSLASSRIAMNTTAKHGFTLNELAERVGATVVGNGEARITRLATLHDAGPEDLAFLANPSYLRFLHQTRAGGVLIREEHKDSCPVPALLLKDPYLGYALLSQLFDPVTAEHVPAIHDTAVIADTATIGERVSIGPHVYIGEHAVIEHDVSIAAGAVVGDGCIVGAATRIYPNATLYHGVTLGARCIIHSSAVLGGDGFGFAFNGGGWTKIAQLGGVRIGNDVEIGSCSSVDRGALGDTIIGDDVKIDSQVQIAHNVHIGDHSALAGCVGIAGSTKIGRGCLLGGGVGIAGHLEIGDRVQITGMSLVTHSIQEPGVYSSGTGSMPNAQWRKNAVRFKQLDEMARRISKLEKR